MIDGPDLLTIFQKLNVLSQDQVEAILTTCEAEDKKVRDVLLDMDILDEESMFQYYAQHCGLPYEEIDEYEPDPELIRVIDNITAQQYLIFPLTRDGTFIKFACTEPMDLKEQENLQHQLEASLDFVMVNERKLNVLIDAHYGLGAENFDDIVDELGLGGGDDKVAADLDDAAAAESAPIIRLVNMLLLTAIKGGTSDIHFEPEEVEFAVRFRTDGVLVEQSKIPKKAQGAVLARLKIMSGMDIAEKRVPQDGRIKIKMMGKEVDFRVSNLPILYGESVVLRILDKSSVSLGLEQVGFIEDNKRIFDDLIRKPNGIILVTGPTGSGKTTTLYSALGEINTPDRKIITVEDPVEYMLDGINQVQVNNTIGLTFAVGLRAMLRQSPDVILVGEMRDLETASIGIRAALTGHLVFSTLHTNDAPSSVTRLIDMGVSPFMIASSLQAAMAQRLCRKVCSKCKEPFQPSEKILKEVGFPNELMGKATFFKGAGCDTCGKTGYKGRTGIFELMVVNEEIKELILGSKPSYVIKEAAQRNGMRMLRDDGFRKVALGMTTIDEVLANG